MLTNREYNILRILRRLRAPLPILEMVSRTVTMVNRITWLIGRFEAGGFVERKRCEIDCRGVNVSLTKTGMGNVTALDKLIVALNKKLFKHMEREEIFRHNGLLEKASGVADGSVNRALIYSFGHSI